MVNHPIDVIGDFKSPRVDPALKNADDAVGSIVIDSFGKVGSTENSDSDLSRGGKRVTVYPMTEALSWPRNKPLSEDALSSLKSGSVVGNHPFVVAAVIA